MRVSLIYPLVLFVTIALTGCSAASGASSPAAGGQSASPAPTVSAPAVSSSQKGTPNLAQVAQAADPSTMASDASDPTVAAIQAVIQKGDQEQQDAFAKNDPTLMKDTSTSDYYDQVAQINSDMANGGVTGIRLVKIEWGPVSLTNPTTASATAYETWETTYTDGSSDQARELNVYTLVQDQGAWKVQSDEHPNSDPNSSTGTPATNPSNPVAPSAPSGAPAPGSDTSRNWSGYAASDGQFTSVTGTWTVPQPKASASSATGATWVGIGGVNTRDLIQAGTEETVTGSGTVQYDAWIEMLPRASRPVSFAVKAGDSVTVSISQQGTNQWLIQFKNNTTGEGYQTTVQYTSSLSSVEWVEEAPAIGRRLAQIDDFGTIQFSAGSATKDGKTVTIADSGAQPITMTTAGGGSVVTPSVLTPDGQGFSVTESTTVSTIGSGRGFGR